MTTSRPHRYSARAAALRSSAIREILRVVDRPDVLSLAGGLPAPELFPTGALGELAAALFASADGRRALQYGETEGLAELRVRIAAQSPFGATADRPEHVLVTHGSQQALDLLAKLFVDPGEEVLVETPAYVGALQPFRFFGARVTFLPCDRAGPLPGALELALARRPRLLYLTPTFQNPSGLCQPEERRAALRAIVARFPETLLVEDDPYRALWFDRPPPPPLVAGLDPARAVYLGTFSKTVAPGLRVGFLVGGEEVVRRCALAKQATDLHTNTLGQVLIARFLGHAAYPEHVERIRAAYRARRDALEEALTAQLGGRLAWERPAGGMFLWARLVEGGDAAELLRVALAHGVAFVPGAEFSPPGEGASHLRLNFTHTPRDRLGEGIARLARAIDGWRRR